MWSPDISSLGTHGEYEAFSHAVEYYIEDNITRTYYDVRIIPQQTNPPTVTTTAGNPATISGLFRGVYNDTLTVMNKDRSYTTVVGDGDGGVFDKLDRNVAHEVISFRPDGSRSRTFSYVAEAYNPLNPTVVIDSRIYTIHVQDLNWTPGLIALKELISYVSNS